MYKEIFYRMLPIFIGSLIGVVVLVAIFYGLKLADAKHAVLYAAFTLGSYCIINFFLTRKEVIAENLDAHRIHMPLPIVYTNEKFKLYEEPYLDLEKIDKVWGFDVGKTFFSIFNFKDEDIEKFSLEIFKVTEKKLLLSGTLLARLPESEELMLIRKNYQKVKATIMLLKFFGVKADDWINGPYLALDEREDDDFLEDDMETKVYLVDMTQDNISDKEEISSCHDVTAYVRLVAM